MNALESLITAAWGSPDLTPELIAAARAEQAELVEALREAIDSDGQPSESTRALLAKHEARQ